MENSACDHSNSYGEDGHSELPPGFRFHPTDEELISQYLSPKTLDTSFSPNAVGVVDLNKCEPWDLPSPRLAKTGTHEWYFFSLRDKKYPNGLRTNRATDAGYWKATGKDKDVHKGNALVGLKKTLVFYIGRAPNGEKSNWIMHEYRLCPSTLSSKSEWVICRVYHKSSSGRSFPLMSEPPTHAAEQTELIAQTMMNPQAAAQCDNNQIIDVMQNTPIAPTYPTQGYYPVVNEGPYPAYPSEISPFKGNSQYPYGLYLANNNGGGMELQQQHGMLEPEREIGFAGSISPDMSNYDMGGGPFADQAGPSTSYEPTDIDSFWNY